MMMFCFIYIRLLGQGRLSGVQIIRESQTGYGAASRTTKNDLVTVTDS